MSAHCWAMLRSPSTDESEKSEWIGHRLVPCLERATEVVDVRRRAQTEKSLSTATTTTTTTFGAVRVCKRHAADATRLRIRYIPPGLLVATRRVRTRARGCADVDRVNTGPDASSSAGASELSSGENEVKNEQQVVPVVASIRATTPSPRVSPAPAPESTHETPAPLAKSHPEVESQTPPHGFVLGNVAPSRTGTGVDGVASSSVAEDVETSGDAGEQRERESKDAATEAEPEADDDGDEYDADGEGDGEGDEAARSEKKRRESDADDLESCVDTDKLKVAIRALIERLDAEKSRSQRLADELAVSRADAKSLRQAAMDSFLRPIYADDP